MRKRQKRRKSRRPSIDPWVELVIESPLNRKDRRRQRDLRFLTSQVKSIGIGIRKVIDDSIIVIEDRISRRGSTEQAGSIRGLVVWNRTRKHPCIKS